MKLPKYVFFMNIATNLSEDFVEGNFATLMKMADLAKGLHRIPKIVIEDEGDRVIIRFPSLESITGLYSDLPNAYKSTIYVDEDLAWKTGGKKRGEFLEWLKTCELTKIGFEYDAAPQFDPI